MSKSSGSDGPLHAASKVISHQIRRDFIRTLEASGKPLSAKMFAEAEDLSLSRVSYHTRLLETLGVTRCVDEIKRRGATEYRYLLGGPNCAETLRLLSNGTKKSPPPSDGVTGS